MIRNSLVPAQLAQLPWKVILTVIAITSFGLVVLYSAAGGSLEKWALGQGLRFCVFLAGAVALSRVREQQIKSAVVPAYVILIVALVFTELLGKVAGGGQRWLNLGIIRLQPSELMKPVIVLMLARFYDMLPAGEIRRWNAIWPALGLIGVPAALILVQPDLGTAMMVLAGGAVTMFLAGLPLRLFIGGALSVIPIGAGAWSMMHEYQRNRVLIFLDPESDPLGKGYHISQSKIAIGSGGLFGKGFLNGTQSHLNFLPEKQTDFIYPLLAEEWGLWGSLALLALFALVAYYGVIVALR
ncbi:MAG TPA: FtsW/RodA/SpoVE family cell cycle protein, partial [Sphingomonas sp.]|nr:FtsW/RodA/SpoVE family cell cycle protein [Sphingomonas sp.]